MSEEYSEAEVHDEAITKKRRPLIALLLSLICPGLGHLYAGSLRASIFWFVGFFVSANIILAVLIFWDAAPYNIWLPAILIVLIYLTMHLSAYISARKQPVDYQLKSFNKIFWYILLFVGYGFILIYFWPAFGNYESFKIPAMSMMNTLKVGDFLIADLEAYSDSNPERNDIIVFIYPHDGQTKYIKRVIGLPGDTVKIVSKKLLVNNRPFEPPKTAIFIDTLSDGSPKIQPRQNGQNNRDNYGPTIVPEYAYFVIGDSWDNSFDSRYWGFVPHEYLLGQAIRITYSDDWGRIGQTVE